MGRHIFYTYVYITTTKSSIGCIFSKDDVRRYLKQLGTICAEKTSSILGSGLCQEPKKSLGLFVCLLSVPSLTTYFEACNWSMQFMNVIVLGSHWSEYGHSPNKYTRWE